MACKACVVNKLISINEACDEDYEYIFLDAKAGRFKENRKELIAKIMNEKCKECPSEQ